MYASIFAVFTCLKKLIHKIFNWEALPFRLLYAPLTPLWAWYMLRSGSVWFFTPSNPKITFGGLEGEPKKEMYDLLPTHLYPKTLYVLPNENFDDILKRIEQAGFNFPFVVKPQVGWQGVLFRKIDKADELKHYHSNMVMEYMVQELVEYPMEVSVFYIRHPQNNKGIITGFLHKVPLQVTGDGKLSLEELVLLHPKGKKRVGELHSKHKEKWHTIIPQGEKCMLSYAANHNRGAHFIDLKGHIDDTLIKMFDQLSNNNNGFFYGRYDIMCSSVEELKAGKNFTILEYNGCGAEPNHFYDTGYTLAGAYREILKHWKALYTISKYNSKNGVKPWPFLKGWRFLQYSKKLNKQMKETDEKIG